MKIVALKEEGFIFLAISPGVVNTSTKRPTEEQLKEVMKLAASFKTRYPNWTGPVQPSESVAMMLKVIDNLKPEDSGKFLSHKVSLLYRRGRCLPYQSNQSY